MILLDTHVLIWWVSSPEKLSKSALKAIQEERKKNQRILASSISVWEIHLLIKKGKLKLILDTDALIKRIEQLPFVQFIPVDNVIASKSVTLPDPLHADPADRMIVTTAREYGATLVTSDRKLLDYPHVKSIW